MRGLCFELKNGEEKSKVGIRKRGKDMDCEWIAILKRAGKEVKRSEFHEPDEADAVRRVEMMLELELKEKRRKFPYTEEFQANAILFRGFREW